jgi:NADH-quinone oxidoreductase subunit J
MDRLLFYLFGFVTLVGAIGVLLNRRVFYSALSLIVCLSALSGVYMVLESPFIAAVQVIVYAGAIMVLFLFVIMLLDPFAVGTLKDKKRSLIYLGPVVAVSALAMLYPLLRTYTPDRAVRGVQDTGAAFGTVKTIGESLFRDYLLPFEVTSVLILVAIIGVVVLAKRQS